MMKYVILQPLFLLWYFAVLFCYGTFYGNRNGLNCLSYRFHTLNYKFLFYYIGIHL